MKIGIYLEGSPDMGGGFFQSLKSSLLLMSIEKYKSKHKKRRNSISPCML